MISVGTIFHIFGLGEDHLFGPLKTAFTNSIKNSAEFLRLSLFLFFLNISLKILVLNISSASNFWFRSCTERNILIKYFSIYVVVLSNIINTRIDVQFVIDFDTD